MGRFFGLINFRWYDCKSMIIRDADKRVAGRNGLQRSKYSYRLLANRVTRDENDEALVGRGVLGAAGFILEPFWETPGDLEGDAYRAYMDDHSSFDIMVRQRAYERLVQAQHHLPAPWQLVIKAGFRPLEVQLALLAAFYEKSQTERPNWTEAQHLKHAQTFVSDPRIICPPHVTGGAVDIAVKNTKTGEYIDMGCPPNTDSEVSFLHSDKVSPQQYSNRMVLLEAMLRAGFAPNVYEWWHYQYGETYWAAFYGHKTTLYDLITVQ